MAITNLWQYYSSQGTKLPSISERSKLFQKLGLGSGSGYRGTAAQNTKLLNALKSGGTTKKKSVTGSSAGTTEADKERKRQATIAAEEAKKARQLADVVGKQRKYADTWGYDDVEAAKNPQFKGYIDSLLKTNDNPYSNEDVSPDFVTIADQIAGGTLFNDPNQITGTLIADNFADGTSERATIQPFGSPTSIGGSSQGGVGNEFLKQLAIASQLYGPEWQREATRFKEDFLTQEQASNEATNQAYDQNYDRFATSGIRGGLQNAQYTQTGNKAAGAYQTQARQKSRALDDRSRSQREQLIGYASDIRNQKIDQYNRQAITDSGITDPNLLQQAYNFGGGGY